MTKKGDNEEKKDSVNNNYDSQKKKKLTIRAGDWYCGYCKNLNFSYRNFCNRCKLCKFYWN